MMSDSEKRRKELLEQTRERYSDYHTPPGYIRDTDLHTARFTGMMSFRCQAH